MRIGLRIDVDTWRGTAVGVPRLCQILKERSTCGTFFFSVGPDNMGRHLWRLLRPQFLIKMLRSNAPSLYGWDIVLRGTAWPGRLIGRGQSAAIRRAADDGHEIGVHAWDHHAWQMTAHRAGPERIDQWTERAVQELTEVAGRPPTCAASPGWRTSDSVLESRERFAFHFNSDCRGTSIFRPVVHGAVLSQPQIPNTLPTYDEVIGRNGITDENYNDYLIGLLRPDRLNVLTIHAEVEGIICASLCEEFLDRVIAQGGQFVPLGDLLPASRSGQDEQSGGTVKLGCCPLERQVISGREGWIAVQGKEHRCQ